MLLVCVINTIHVLSRAHTYIRARGRAQKHTYTLFGSRSFYLISLCVNPLHHPFWIQALSVSNSSSSIFLLTFHSLPLFVPAFSALAGTPAFFSLAHLALSLSFSPSLSLLPVQERIWLNSLERFSR